MARTTKATTAKSETAPAPVVDSAAVAAPVVEKAVKAKKGELNDRRRTSEQEIVDYIKTIEELGK